MVFLFFIVCTIFLPSNEIVRILFSSLPIRVDSPLKKLVISDKLGFGKAVS